MEQAAASMRRPADVGETLRALTVGAVDAIDGADLASITTRHGDGRLETIAATDPLVERLDARQYELREGPCYETATDETFTVSFDMAHDGRWPRYGRVAAEAGVHAQMGIALSSDDDGSRSALNVYAVVPHRFAAGSVEAAELFASHASVAMGFVKSVRTISATVTSRQIIGQAVGIVMERYQLDDERAFRFLVRTSQQSNVKLREVAAQIVDGHNSRTRPQAD
jgi:ANTAR domain/GAF domain